MGERSRTLRYVAAATVLGWILFDLTVVALSPEPLLVTKLLRPAALALALAVIAGWMWDRYPATLGLTLGVAGGLCVASLMLADDVPRTWVGSRM
jgi:hypothetical protein